jgi:hypothetical protein
VVHLFASVSDQDSCLCRGELTLMVQIVGDHGGLRVTITKKRQAASSNSTLILPADNETAIS